MIGIRRNARVARVVYPRSPSFIGVRRVWILLLLITGVLLLPAIVPIRTWYLATAENAAGYFLPLAAVGVISMPWWWRATHWSISLCCCMLLLLGLSTHAAVLHAFYLSAPLRVPLTEQAPSLRVLVVNIGSENPIVSDALDTIRAKEAQVLALLETTKEAVEGFANSYPHRFFLEQANGFGIGVVSLLPFKEAPHTSLGVGVRSIVHTELEISDTLVLPLFVCDAPPPFDDDQVEQSWLLVRRLSTLLRHEVNTGLVLTDLNATPFSRFYKILVKEGMLQDVRWGEGMTRTWDMHRSWMRFAIDHAFIKGNVEVLRSALIEMPGSDHRGIMLDIKVQ